jgi:hypothetical protein
MVNPQVVVIKPEEIIEERVEEEYEEDVELDDVDDEGENNE